MPTPSHGIGLIGFERFEENRLDSATILEEEEQEQQESERSTVDTMSVWIYVLK